MDEIERCEFSDGVVYLDTTLTPDIKSEGYSREIIRRIQEMRKELDLDVDDEIRVDIEVDDQEISGYIDDKSSYIAEETRAIDISSQIDDGLWREWSIEELDISIGIEKA